MYLVTLFSTVSTTDIPGFLADAEMQDSGDPVRIGWAPPVYPKNDRLRAPRHHTADPRHHTADPRHRSAFGARDAGGGQKNTGRDTKKHRSGQNRGGTSVKSRKVP